MWHLAGVAYDPVPIAAFRHAHALPKTFGVAYFQPKDFTGLASIDGAGAHLQHLRNELLGALPTTIARPLLLAQCEALAHDFAQRLQSINVHIGLRESELGFAVAGFSDFLQSWAFAQWRAYAQHQPPPTAAQVYAQWLSQSMRLEGSAHAYAHANVTWQVWVVHDLYGRAGLLVDTGTARHAVADPVYSCPANAFMQGLLCALADALAARLGSA